MFDDIRKTVNFTGKEYIDYLKMKKSNVKLTKKQKEAIFIFSMCFLGIMLIAVLINDLTYIPAKGIDYRVLLGMPWTQLIKLGMIVAFPFLIISWIIHGVQLRLLA